MKILLFTLLLLCVLPSFAQVNKIEVKLGIGYLSDSPIKETFLNRVFPLFLPFIKHDYDIKTSGVYAADVFFNTKISNLKAGISYAGETFSIKLKYYNSETTIRKCTNSFLASVQYNYLIKTRTYFYSGIGLGMKTIQSNSQSSANETIEKQIRFAYHVNTIGFHYGNNVAGFCETGLGAKGLIRVGIAVKI